MGEVCLPDMFFYEINSGGGVINKNRKKKGEI